MNSNKPAAYLEELKASGQIEGYTVIPIKLTEDQQKSEWFEAVNPNVSTILKPFPRECQLISMHEYRDVFLLCWTIVKGRNQFECGNRELPSLFHSASQFALRSIHDRDTDPAMSTSQRLNPPILGENLRS